MRRMVKEELLTFEGKPLFPERRAYTVPYELSDGEQDLYEEVTQYVREEMNRAERLKAEGEGRRGNTVGFALTVLQRRLASSPEAIFTQPRTAQAPPGEAPARDARAAADWRSDLPASASTRSLTVTTTSSTSDSTTSAGEELEELEEERRRRRHRRAHDRRARAEIATSPTGRARATGPRLRAPTASGPSCATILQDNALTSDADGQPRKLIIFTEHRDTLNYLVDQIRTLLGRPEAVVAIHGGVRARGAPRDPGAVHAGPGRAASWSPPTPPARASTSSAPT